MDEAAFRLLLDRLLGGGVHALFVTGTAGLGSFLTNGTYERAVRIAAEHVAGRVPVLAGVLEPSTARAVERARMARDAGADAVVAVAPFYFRVQNERQLLRHFELIRDAAEEMAVYNLPGCTGTEIPLAVVGEMARRGWITACKDSSGNADYFAGLCRLGGETGLRVYQGLRPDFFRRSLTRLAQEGIGTGRMPEPFGE